MTHLPEPCGREALGVYECIRVSRNLGALDDAGGRCHPMGAGSHPASPSSPSSRGHGSREDVFDYDGQEPIEGRQTINGRRVDIKIRRQLRMSLKRLRTDPTAYVGFDALLTMPCWEDTQTQPSGFGDALNGLPVALYADGSMLVEHTIILYRVSLLHSKGAGSRCLQHTSIRA